MISSSSSSSSRQMIITSVRNKLQTKLQQSAVETTQHIERLLELENNLTEKKRHFDTLLTLLEDDIEKLTKSISMISNTNSRVEEWIENQENLHFGREIDDNEALIMIHDIASKQFVFIMI